MKKYLIPLLILLLSVCMFAGCNLGGSSSTSDAPSYTLPEKENDSSLDEPSVSTQNKLLSAIDATSWRDEEAYYRFNTDGSISKYVIDKSNGKITESVSSVIFTYTDGILYFICGDDKDEVKITTEPKEKIESVFGLCIERCDFKFISAYVTTKRNISEIVSIAYVDGAVIYDGNYNFYADEAATTPLSDCEFSAPIFAYPNDLKTFTVACKDTDFRISLHSYMSDNFIFSIGLSLPTLPSTASWTYNDRKFDTLYQIVEYMECADENIGSEFVMELEAAYHSDETKIKGKYRYENSIGETFLAVVSFTSETHGIFAIYFEGDDDCLAEYEWDVRQTEYIFRDVGGTFEPTASGNIILKSAAVRKEMEYGLVSEIELTKIL